MKKLYKRTISIGFSYTATPVCFYPTQAVQQLRVPQKPVWTMQQVTPPPGIGSNQGGKLKSKRNYIIKNSQKVRKPYREHFHFLVYII